MQLRTRKSLPGLVRAAPETGPFAAVPRLAAHLAERTTSDVLLLFIRLSFDREPAAHVMTQPRPAGCRADTRGSATGHCGPQTTTRVGHSFPRPQQVPSDDSFLATFCFSGTSPGDLFSTATVLLLSPNRSRLLFTPRTPSARGSLAVVACGQWPRAATAERSCSWFLPLPHASQPVYSLRKQVLSRQ